MQNFSYENEFDLHENELVGETHFHKNGFALTLILAQRQTRTWIWAIAWPKYDLSKHKQAQIFWKTYAEVG